VIALLGQLCGQLNSLRGGDGRLVEISDRITALLKQKRTISEATKRRFSHEIQGVLDAMLFGQSPPVEK
jgi:hypothetical protein